MGGPMTSHSGQRHELLMLVFSSLLRASHVEVLCTPSCCRMSSISPSFIRLIVTVAAGNPAIAAPVVELGSGVLGSDRFFREAFYLTLIHHLGDRIIAMDEDLAATRQELIAMIYSLNSVSSARSPVESLRRC